MRVIVAPVLAAFVLAAVVFGGKIGPRTTSVHNHRRNVTSPNRRWEVVTYESNDPRYPHYWGNRAVDRQDQSRYVDYGCGMWYDMLGICGDAFVSDDGELLIALDPYADCANSVGAVQFHDRNGNAAIPYRNTICDYPRWLFPFEPRPAAGWFPGTTPPSHKWVSAASFDGRLLHVETTGLYSVDVDVKTRAVVARRFNYATIVRWIVYALICIAPIVILLRALMACIQRLYRWVRLRFFSPDLNRCRGCGYLLFGLAEARCPECGTRFDANVARPLPK